jgi:hypothetical protein
VPSPNTAPLGLLGETVTMARVRSVIGGAQRVDARLIPFVGGDRDDAAARHLNRHLVVEVERDVQNDLVARLGDRRDRVHERHVRAGGHHHRRAAADFNRVLRAQLRGQPIDEPGRPEPSWYSCVAGARARRGPRRAPLRRPVVHDALAERNGARRLTNQVADDLDDRRLHGVHPGQSESIARQHYEQVG